MKANRVLRAKRAIEQSPDTRAMKRELAEGNPYMRGWLEKQGCRVEGTTIIRRVR